MGSRSEPVAPPISADHVIAMCNGGVKAIICNGTATVVKATVVRDATAEPTEPDTEEPPTTTTEILPPVQNDVIDPPVCPPRLIITDVDGVDFDQWEDFVDAASSSHGSDQSDLLPTVIDASATPGMNIY